MTFERNHLKLRPILIDNHYHRHDEESYDDIDNNENDSAIVQGDKNSLKDGQRVVIIYGNDIRVLPYEEE